MFGLCMTIYSGRGTPMIYELVFALYMQFRYYPNPLNCGKNKEDTTEVNQLVFPPFLPNSALIFTTQHYTLLET